MLRIADCVLDRVRLAVPQATERQHVGNRIDAAFIFARADFVTVDGNKMITSRRYLHQRGVDTGGEVERPANTATNSKA